MYLLQMLVERLPFSHLIIRLEPITLNIKEVKKKTRSKWEKKLTGVSVVPYNQRQMCFTDTLSDEPNLEL